MKIGDLVACTRAGFPEATKRPSFGIILKMTADYDHVPALNGYSPHPSNYKCEILWDSGKKTLVWDYDLEIVNENR